jgi:hypothetical protein
VFFSFAGLCPKYAMSMSGCLTNLKKLNCQAIGSMCSICMTVKCYLTPKQLETSRLGTPIKPLSIKSFTTRAILRVALQPISSRGSLREQATTKKHEPIDWPSLCCFYSVNDEVNIPIFTN